MNKNKAHIIIGKDAFLVKKKIHDILINKWSIAKNEPWTHYSVNDISEKWVKVRSDILTGGLFAPKVLIFNFHNDIKNHKQQKQVFTTLINSPNIIFITLEEPKTTKNWKELINNSEVYQISKVTDLQKQKLIIKIVNQNHIVYEKNVMTFLTSQLPNDMNIIHKELDKIVKYCQNTPQILTVAICQEIINKHRSGTIFPLIASIIENDCKNAIMHYNSFAHKDLSPLILVTTLKTYLHLIQQIGVLEKKKMSPKQIAFHLKKSPFFIINLINIKNNSNQNNFNNLITKIYNLEHQTKTLNWNNQSLIEYFLIT